MTCLKATVTPVELRLPPRRPDLTSHQQATLLALHFESATWTPCVSGPALVAASAIIRSAEFPAELWDVWFLPAPGRDRVARSSRCAVKRARLRAAAVLATDAAGPELLMVVEERVAPGGDLNGGAGRRFAARLAMDPFAARAEAPAAVDPAAMMSIRPMTLRLKGAQWAQWGKGAMGTMDSANPQPDVTVDLAAMGLIAPRAESW